MTERSRFFKGPVKMAGSACLLTALICSTATANSGTPLMWVPLFRLICVNILIGLCEGLAICLLFGVWDKGNFRKSLGRAAGIMILANYFSMLVGEAWLLGFFRSLKPTVLGEEPLYNLSKFLMIMLGITFTLTVILEWTFGFWLLKKKKHRVLKAGIAVLVVNICSYAVLTGLYLSAGSISLYRHFEVDKSLSFARNENAWIYFIDINDGNIYRIRTDGGEREYFFEANLNAKKQRTLSSTEMFAWPSKEAGYYDLWHHSGDGKNKIITEKFTRRAADYSLQESQRYRGESSQSDPNTLRLAYVDRLAADMRGAESSAVQVTIPWWWPATGLLIKDEQTGENYNAAVETPFLMDWYSKDATILPGDQVVYQLGEQIVLLDLNERKMGLITLGRSPVVGLE